MLRRRTTVLTSLGTRAQAGDHARHTLEHIGEVLGGHDGVLEGVDGIGSKQLADSIEDESGEAAIELLATHTLAALFTDVNLAGPIDGFHVARAVNRVHPNASLIVVSGACSANDGDMPEDATFLSKPYDLRAVVTIARQMIAQNSTFGAAIADHS